MIEVDDAGNGCPILGEVFAARRIETGEQAAVYVPLPSETSLKTSKEEYIMSLLTQLNVPKDEAVLLCRGNTLNGFERQLQHKGFDVKRGKISEETDKIAENFFMERLYDIGFPQDLSLSNREYREFYQMVKIWYISLYHGNKNLFKSKRKRNVKTRGYMHNPVYHFPNVLRELFY
ncbi:hypothetical protein [Fictibacillus sp. KU28468]|uniref:hypothetical protein n=1 Tax=Fictibacillus sp. KU28468 TaxID=2991053 RepID=UPI00223CDC1C|nr:hypothetical protein [Fictibacillus sp. KU28468]UZJ78543.1 hypothetical protein OKX00_20855 [Fictibacillus sp. KU28468]